MENNNCTIEKLHHFSCTVCQKWWTIGDADEDKKIWYCPWCGEKNIYDRTKEK